MNAAVGPDNARWPYHPGMQTFLVLMTGRNASNLAPLLKCWELNDHVLLVPTLPAPLRAAERFQAQLQYHGVTDNVFCLAQMGSTPEAVAQWCEKNKQLLGSFHKPSTDADIDRPSVTEGQRAPANSLVLIGNGGTKPMQDALVTWLDLNGQSCRRLYAEATPARMHLLDREHHSPVSGWASTDPAERWVGLEDLLAIAGMRCRDGEGQRLWHQMPCRQPVPPPSQDSVDFRLPLQDLDDPSDDEPPSQVQWLRHQVATSVVERINADPGLADLMSEVWLAPVIEEDNPDEREMPPLASWDVLLLLRNGMLIHLDCSRWFPGMVSDAVHESLLALVDRTGWCVPLPAQAGHETLAGHCHRVFGRHTQFGRTILPWVSRDDRITVPGIPGYFDSGAFKAAFDGLLKPYRCG